MMGADAEHGEAGGGVAVVAPCVAGAVLYDGVAGPQVDLDAVIELQPHLAVEDDLEVDGVRRVHPRSIRLHVAGQPRQGGLKAAQGRLDVGGWLGGGLPASRWDREHAEAVTADRR